MNSQQILEALKPVTELFGNHPWVQSLIVLLTALLAARLVEWLVVRVLRKLAARTAGTLDDYLVAALHRPLFWSVALLGVLVAAVPVDPPAGVTTLLQGSVASVLVLLWSAFVLRAGRRILRALAQRERPQALLRAQTLPLFDNLAIVVVVALAIYFVFNAWGVDMTAWLASAGIVGIAVGFAAKDTLANLFSGVFIMADAPYQIGDYVVLENGQRGEITHIGIRSTRLLTRDDVEVTVPNSIMGNTMVINESGGPHEKFRIRVQVAVAYGSDIDQVRAVLMGIADADPGVCAEPEPRVRFRTFGASGLDFELLGWVEKPELRGRILDALNSAVYKRFLAEGIEIPYAKQDLYIKELPEVPPR